MNTEAQPQDGFLLSRHILQRYRITAMTLHRWMRDARVLFPQPIYFGRYRYWKIAEIESWERKRATTRQITEVA